MPFPATPRAILRLLLVVVLTATALANAVLLIAMPERVAGAWPFDLSTGVVRLVGIGLVVLAILPLWRAARAVPLLVAAGVTGLPLMTIIVQAQPMAVAALLMTAIVAGCALLEDEWVECMWAGRRF
ncbi:MAG: hypothetical protein PGN21_03405 [Sphingomonas paucimobilis]